MSTELEAVLQRMRDVFGDEEVVVVPPADPLVELPEPLRAFYALYDGLELPFLEIHPGDGVEGEGLDGWWVFGRHGYFGLLVCTKDGDDPRLGSWDHEAGVPPEAYCTTIAELIESCFDDSADLSVGVIIEGVPEDHDPELLAYVLDNDFELDDPAQLADELSNLPDGFAAIDLTNLEEALRALERLRRDGYTCSLGGMR